MDDYYKTPQGRAKLEAAQRQEKTRQEFLRGEATPETLAYARFLNAVENDATMAHGDFKEFRHNDDEIFREYPFLIPTQEAN